MKTADVAMPGAQSNRTDNTVVGRVQKIQRDAKFSEMAGGAYNTRNSNAQIVSQGGVNLPTASATSADINTTSSGQLANFVSPIDLNAVKTSGLPLSHGANGGAGADASINMPPVDQIDNGEMLARAMYLANPTPQLRRIVESYNETSSFPSFDAGQMY